MKMQRKFYAIHDANRTKGRNGKNTDKKHKNIKEICKEGTENAYNETENAQKRDEQETQRRGFRES